MHVPTTNVTKSSIVEVISAWASYCAYFGGVDRANPGKGCAQESYITDSTKVYNQQFGQISLTDYSKALLMP